MLPKAAKVKKKREDKCKRDAFNSFPQLEYIGALKLPHYATFQKIIRQSY